MAIPETAPVHKLRNPDQPIPSPNPFWVGSALDDLQSLETLDPDVPVAVESADFSCLSASTRREETTLRR